MIGYAILKEKESSYQTQGYSSTDLFFFIGSEADMVTNNLRTRCQATAKCLGDTILYVCTYHFELVCD